MTEYYKPICYEFVCDDCENIFEKRYFEIPKRIPKTWKCNECGERCPRFITPPSFAIRGYNPLKKKVGQEDVDNVLRDAIEASKEDLANPVSPYARYHFTPDTAKARGARPLTPDETAKKMELARKQTIQAKELADKKK